MTFAERDHAFEEAENVLICAKLAPVEPSRCVVLIVRIIVAELRVQEFIPGAEHWNPVRQHKQATEILHLPATQCHNLSWRGFITFVPTVPTVIIVHAVLIAVSIRPVALSVVRDEVVESETVM